MVGALDDKRTATRFRVLVEIADRQPAVSQGEVAEAVGITAQAVSEYTRELVDDGYVEKEGRSRYRVTKEGVDWLFQQAHALSRYADRVTEDVLGGVLEDAAIATADIEEGQTVTLTLRDGLMHATPGVEGPATGVATTDAPEGGDVGVTGFEGVIDITEGDVTVVQVPPIRSGGTRLVDLAALAERCTGADVVTASGVEAVVACRRAGVTVTTHLAAGAVAAAAATLGLDAAVIATGDSVGRITDALREEDLVYELVEVATVDDAVDAGDGDGTGDGDGSDDRGAGSGGDDGEEP
jgi:putative transcriptional regulator